MVPTERSTIEPSSFIQVRKPPQVAQNPRPIPGVAENDRSADGTCSNDDQFPSWLSLEVRSFALRHLTQAFGTWMQDQKIAPELRRHWVH